LNYRGKFFAIVSRDLPLVLYRADCQKGKLSKPTRERSDLARLTRYFKSTVYRFTGTVGPWLKFVRMIRREPLGQG